MWLVTIAATFVVTIARLSGRAPFTGRVGHEESVSAVERTTRVQLQSTTKTAALLDCSVRTIYRLVDRGELRPVRLGRVLRFEADEIERYLERNREPVASP